MTLLQEQQPIAVVGMACRFPGARNVQEYWERLCQGESSIVRPSEDVLRSMGVPEEVLSDERYVPAAGLLEDMDLFDPGYFGISPGEAENMDPQHRIFLQEAVHALEHAGIADPGRRPRIGVFCGTGENRYAELLERPDDAARAHRHMIDTPAALPLRVSYHLDLNGPSVFVSSLCSTSLTAVHLARRSLLAGDCDVALAGAVSLQLPRHHGYRAVDGGVASATGELRPFDAAADGTLPGSGVGIVVLKRLGDVHDRDVVHAVIRGSALNNDGANKQSFAAPSVDGQREVIVAALADAGVDPTTIGFVEAHGTGTPLGDPIEMAALKEARARLGVSSPCAIGAVKSSVGHLDTAAGMAGLIKTVIAVREGVVPAMAGHVELSPAIDLDGTGLFVNTRTQPWPQTAVPRRAAVTALGVGGTNAHVILEAPSTDTSGEAVPAVDLPEVFPVSAHSAASFERLCTELAHAVAGGPDLPAASIAATLQHRRGHRRLRRAWVYESAGEFAEALGSAPRPAVPGELVLHVDLEREGRFSSDPALGALLPGLAEEQPDGGGSDGLESRLRTACRALEWLRDLGVRPHALSTTGAGVYAAAAHAGGLPVDVARRCVRLHELAFAAVRDHGDLDAAEQILQSLEQELSAAALEPLTCEVRPVDIDRPLRAGTPLTAVRLVDVTRSALLDGFDEQGRTEAVDVLGALGSARRWLSLVAHCWELGAEVAWERLHPGTPARPVDLPLYPFDEQRYWAAGGAPVPAPETAPAAEAVEGVKAPDDVLPVLSGIWEEVLGVSGVKPDDSFFALGGHSLVASQVMVRIRDRLGVRISLGGLLEAETLSGMSALVEHERSSAAVFETLTEDIDDTMGTIEL
ncbi:beta-ketoacyl synthase N-terminal-like domain-containing protein [Streptomyces macrosporus]